MMSKGGDQKDQIHSIEERKLKSEEENILLAKERKEQGNIEYKTGVLFSQHTLGKEKFTLACIHYANGLTYLEEAINNKTKNKELIELYISLLLNCSIVGLKLNSFDTAITCCSRVLVLDPHHAKAFYRRAQVYSEQKRIELAIKDLEEAIKYAPKDKSIHKLLVELEERKAKEEAKRKLQEETINGQLRQSLVKDTKEQNKVITEGYYWSQTLEEIHISIPISKEVSSNDVFCVFKRDFISIKIRYGKEQVDSRLEGNLFKFIKAEESNWTLDKEESMLHIYLWKEIISGEKLDQWETLVKKCQTSLSVQEKQETILKKKTNTDIKEKSISSSTLTNQKDEEKLNYFSNSKKELLVSELKKKFPDIPIVIGEDSNSFPYFNS